MRILSPALLAPMLGLLWALPAARGAETGSIPPSARVRACEILGAWSGSEDFVAFADDGRYSWDRGERHSLGRYKVRKGRLKILPENPGNLWADFALLLEGDALTLGGKNQTWRFNRYAAREPGAEKARPCHPAGRSKGLSGTWVNDDEALDLSKGEFVWVRPEGSSRGSYSKRGKILVFDSGGLRTGFVYTLDSDSLILKDLSGGRREFERE